MIHVVAIDNDGYHRISSHAKFDEAKQAALSHYRPGNPVVLRDGRTGQRYSVEELKAGRRRQSPKAA